MENSEHTEEIVKRLKKPFVRTTETGIRLCFGTVGRISKGDIR